MCRIQLSQTDIKDIEDEMVDPSLSDKPLTILLVIWMRSGGGGKHGLIAKCLKLHAITFTPHKTHYVA